MSDTTADLERLGYVNLHLADTGPGEGMLLRLLLRGYAEELRYGDECGGRMSLPPYREMHAPRWIAALYLASCADIPRHVGYTDRSNIIARRLRLWLPTVAASPELKARLAAIEPQACDLRAVCEITGDDLAPYADG